jgi:hypothetical protein
MIRGGVDDGHQDEVLDMVGAGGGEQVAVALPVNGLRGRSIGGAESALHSGDDRSDAGHCSVHGQRVPQIADDDLNVLALKPPGALEMAGEDTYLELPGAQALNHPRPKRSRSSGYKDHRYLLVLRR